MSSFQLRFEGEDEALHERVKAQAEANRRSMNAQILWMLEQQLDQERED